MSHAVDLKRPKKSYGIFILPRSNRLLRVCVCVCVSVEGMEGSSQRVAQDLIQGLTQD